MDLSDPQISVEVRQAVKAVIIGQDGSDCIHHRAKFYTILLQVLEFSVLKFCHTVPVGIFFDSNKGIYCQKKFQQELYDKTLKLKILILAVKLYKI